MWFETIVGLYVLYMTYVGLRHLAVLYVPRVGRRKLEQLLSDDDRSSVDLDWVDATLNEILSRTKYDAPCGERFFLDPKASIEDGQSLYGMLSSRDHSKIAKACGHILRHCAVPSPPAVAVVFDKCDTTHGQGGYKVASIEIESDWSQSFYFVNIREDALDKPEVLGTVLAHELSHILEQRMGFEATGRLVAEKRVDLIAIACGLGELWLRGAIDEHAR